MQNSNTTQITSSPCGLPAHKIAQLIRDGQLTATETIEAHINQIEKENPNLNAIVVKRYDEARAEAAAIDRRKAAGELLPPLAGVPITVKECLDLIGTASTFGLPSRKNCIADADEQHVARLRNAGAIVLGKTNVAQLLIYVETDNPLYGRTNNPWNHKKIAGGSSGGEGAILAVGGSALGIGTDIGGSLRYPANFCGVTSLKPTAGRCPDPGRFSVPVGQTEITSQVGIIARTVDDVALGTQIINGASAPPYQAWMPLGDLNCVALSQLRIAYYVEDGMMPTAKSVKRAVLQAVESLRAAGAQLVEWSPPSPEEAFHLCFTIFSADGTAQMKEMLGSDPAHPSVRALLGLAARTKPTLQLIRAALLLAQQTSLADITQHFGYTRVAQYWKVIEQLQNYRQRFAAAMDNATPGPIDLILGPACALPAYPHGATRELGLAGANTVLYNVLGYPAGVVPVTRVQPHEIQDRGKSFDIVKLAARHCELTSEGLPVGVQIAARPWQEHKALAAMRVVEEAARR